MFSTENRKLYKSTHVTLIAMLSQNILLRTSSLLILLLLARSSHADDVTFEDSKVSQ